MGREAAKQELSLSDWLSRDEEMYRNSECTLNPRTPQKVSDAIPRGVIPHLEPQIVNMAADTLKGGFLPVDQQQSAFFIQAASTVTTHQPASYVLQDPHIYCVEPAEAA